MRHRDHRPITTQRRRGLALGRRIFELAKSVPAWRAHVRRRSRTRPDARHRHERGRRADADHGRDTSCILKNRILGARLRATGADRCGWTGRAQACKDDRVYLPTPPSPQLIIALGSLGYQLRLTSRGYLRMQFSARRRLCLRTQSCALAHVLSERVSLSLPRSRSTPTRSSSPGWRVRDVAARAHSILSGDDTNEDAMISKARPSAGRTRESRGPVAVDGACAAARPSVDLEAARPIGSAAPDTADETSLGRS
jgi:hypothetical protein